MPDNGIGIGKMKIPGKPVHAPGPTPLRSWREPLTYFDNYLEDSNDDFSTFPFLFD